MALVSVYRGRTSRRPKMFNSLSFNINSNYSFLNVYVWKTYVSSKIDIFIGLSLNEYISFRRYRIGLATEVCAMCLIQ